MLQSIHCFHEGSVPGLKAGAFFMDFFVLHEGRWGLRRPGARASGGQGLYPWTPRRAFSPLDTRFAILLMRLLSGCSRMKGHGTKSCCSLLRELWFGSPSVASRRAYRLFFHGSERRRPPAVADGIYNGHCYRHCNGHCNGHCCGRYIRHCHGHRIVFDYSFLWVSM